MGRSRTKLIENEEKPTKFFYTAEKQNKNKKYNHTKEQKWRTENKRRRHNQNSRRILLRTLQKSTNYQTRTRKLSKQISKTNFKQFAP